MSKFLLGSAMLGLKNNRDEDWVEFVDKMGKEINIQGQRSIPYNQFSIKYFISGEHLKANEYNAIYLYQLSNGFMHGEDYPFESFNILDHKEIWVKWLQHYLNSDKIEQMAIKKDVLPKHFYHILYQYYMIKENMHWISEESKEEVQKIHDLDIPSTYFYTLKELINSL